VSGRPDCVAIAQPAALGDVVACLPLAGAVRRHWPSTRIVFIGRAYSRPLIEASSLVDCFLDAQAVLDRPTLLAEQMVEAFINPYQFQDLGRAARTARVPLRIGNLRRPRSWLWANRYITQASRRVQHHRALLNLAYLAPLGLPVAYSRTELGNMLDLDRRRPLPPQLDGLLDRRRFNLVLHPKSHGSAREWPLEHFGRLVELLPPERFKVFVTGTARERELLLAEGALLRRAEVVDLCGALELEQLISFLGAADGFVGASTGPLHIAAAAGVRALGLFPGRDRASAARWHPLGRCATALSLRDVCRPGPGRCPANYGGGACACMSGILPGQVAQAVLAWVG